jgi:NADH dehydrogenase FAD-containing subunit
MTHEEIKQLNWAALAVVITIVGQMCVGVWFASELSSRVSSLERRTANIDKDRQAITRIDERTANILEMLRSGRISYKHQQDNYIHSGES